MDILANIHAAGLQMRQKFLDTDDLLFGFVTTIIDNDIEFRNLFLEFSPEITTGLVAYENSNIFLLV